MAMAKFAPTKIIAKLKPVSNIISEINVFENQCCWLFYCNPGKLLFNIPGSPSKYIVASGSLFEPSLLVKYQDRSNSSLLRRKDISSSNVHCIFSVDPGKKVNLVPSGGEVIFPKRDTDKSVAC
jgi:hypothetical protein